MQRVKDIRGDCNGLDWNYSLGIRNSFIYFLHDPMVGKYALLEILWARTWKQQAKIKHTGDEIVGTVFAIAGLIGLALFVYLFWVLFRGEKL